MSNEKKCEYCEKIIDERRKYCDKECYTKSRIKERITVKCKHPECDNHFDVINIGKAKYCSMKCKRTDLIALKLAGEKHSETIKERYPDGFPNWNKGKTKKTDERLIDFGSKISKTKRDNPDKYFGKNHGMYGKKHTDESKIKMSESHNTTVSLGGQKSWNTGLTKYTNDKLLLSSEKMSRNWLSEKRKKSIEHYTSYLEDTFSIILLELHINYRKQKRIYGKLFDFYLYDYNILVEVDGDYWHANPALYEDKNLKDFQINNKKNDILKNEIAKKYGYTLIRFWEYDIHHNLEQVKMKLLEEIRKHNVCQVVHD